MYENLIPLPNSTIRISDCQSGRPCNTTFTFSSEVSPFSVRDKVNSLQGFVEIHLQTLLNVPDLCVWKEFPCRGGFVDFLAFDKRGRVFLIEVKRSVDFRSKYDVLFQVLKYVHGSHKIAATLFKPDGTFSEETTRRIPQSWLREDENLARLATRLRSNIERQLINPVIAIDEASRPLIEHVSSIVLRTGGAELRVVEINLQRIISHENYKSYDYLYIKWHRTSDDWIGSPERENRTQHDPIANRLAEVVREPILSMIRHLLDTLNSEFKIARNAKIFTLIPCKAYFSFDPDGYMPQGMYPKTNRPIHPHRILLCGLAENTPYYEAVKKLGFRLEKSANGTQVYCVFDVIATTTKVKLEQIATFLANLREE